MNSTNLKKANITLLTSIIIYLMINGAGVFETVVIVPVWTSAPPASFQIFQGEYGLDFKAFWISAHVIHEVSFIFALVANWKIKERKTWLLIIFISHMLLRVWTMAYFAPVIMEFQKIPVTNLLDPILKERAMTWQFLNWFRAALFIFLSLALIPVLLKPNQKERLSSK